MYIKLQQGNIKYPQKYINITKQFSETRIYHCAWARAKFRGDTRQLGISRQRRLPRMA